MAINLPNYERQTTILNNTQEILYGLSGAGKVPRKQVFTENGTWTAPSGVTRVFVTGGGGGGAGSLYNGTTNTAQSGGITSFGTLLSLSGGGGGSSNSNILQAYGGKAGGPGGQNGGLVHYSGGSNLLIGVGGNAGPFFGGYGSVNSSVTADKNGGYCSGGGASALSGAAGCGGSGDFVTDYPLQVTPGTSYAITIGQGGIATVSGNASAGNGGNGILIVEWWE